MDWLFLKPVLEQEVQIAEASIYDSLQQQWVWDSYYKKLQLFYVHLEVTVLSINNNNHWTSLLYHTVFKRKLNVKRYHS